MYYKGDKVRFKDEAVRERRFPPYHLTVIGTYEKDTGCMCLEDAYDLKDELTGQKYYGLPRNLLKKAIDEKPDSEKISKNKKARFRIRKSMFAGFWFSGVPILLIAFLLTKSYWVFAFLLIPLAVGIFGAEDETDENDDY